VGFFATSALEFGRLGKEPYLLQRISYEPSWAALQTPQRLELLQSAIFHFMVFSGVSEGLGLSICLPVSLPARSRPGAVLGSRPWRFEKSCPFSHADVRLQAMESENSCHDVPGPKVSPRTSRSSEEAHCGEPFCDSWDLRCLPHKFRIPASGAACFNVYPVPDGATTMRNLLC
jgi:hypothetical protein